MLPPLGSMHTTDGAVELLLSPLSHTGERSVSFITTANLFGLHKMEQDKRYTMSGVRLSIPIPTNH